MWPWKHKPLTIQTEYGEFTRARPKHNWVANIESRESKFSVHAADVHNQPDPELLSQISRIRRDLETFRALTKEAQPSLDARHSDIRVFKEAKETDFTLEFVNPHNEFDSVCADFKRGQIVESSVLADDDDEV